MPALAAPAQQGIISMQGIQVPASAINPSAFFAATRRQNLLFRTLSSFAGPGSTDLIPVLQTGIISNVRLRVYGTVVVTPGTGTVATTAQWPYNLVKAARFQANGQSNLVNCSGMALKLLSKCNRAPVDDRGVSNYIGGASPGTAVAQGTLAQASEVWGLGSQVTGIGAGTYAFDLVYEIPVAYDPVTLMGAIFAQTQSTDLELAVDWAQTGALFSLTGNATVALNVSATVEGTVFSIPSVNGGIVLPNLSAFHSITESRAPNAIAAGGNEITLAGQGMGRQLMRLAFRVMNGTVPAPLVMNDTNFNQIYWRYGGNTTPEIFQDGKMLRHFDELLYNTDTGLWGYGLFDFSSLWAQRDSVDEGSTTQLRFGYTIPAAVALTAPYCEYVQQVIVAGAVAS